MGSLLTRLRPDGGNNQSRLKVLISITMYAEEMGEFLRTMRGVVADLRFMFDKGMLLKDEALVVVISDGLDRLKREAFLDHLQEIGAFDEEALRRAGFILRDKKEEGGRRAIPKKDAGECCNCKKKKEREMNLAVPPAAKGNYNTRKDLYASQ